MVRAGQSPIVDSDGPEVVAAKNRDVLASAVSERFDECVADSSVAAGSGVRAGFVVAAPSE
jgi:hypothetical protein